MEKEEFNMGRNLSVLKWELPLRGQRNLPWRILSSGSDSGWNLEVEREGSASQPSGPAELTDSTARLIGSKSRARVARAWEAGTKAQGIHETFLVKFQLLLAEKFWT